MTTESLPEAFAAAWDWPHAPQQAHGLFSRIRASKTQILGNYKKIKTILFHLTWFHFYFISFYITSPSD